MRFKVSGDSVVSYRRFWRCVSKHGRSAYSWRCASKQVETPLWAMSIFGDALRSIGHSVCSYERFAFFRSDIDRLGHSSYRCRPKVLRRLKNFFRRILGEPPAGSNHPPGTPSAVIAAPHTRHALSTRRVFPRVHRRSVFFFVELDLETSLQRKEAGFLFFGFPERQATRTWNF